MKIEIKPVKFGDCSIIRGNSNILLIDCGSDNADNGLSSQEFAYSKIESLIKSDEITHILISHFHKDHFNGLLQIPDEYRVQRTFLPYSIINKKVIYTDGLMRLIAIAPPRSWGFQLSKRIIKLFKKLDKISERPEFLKKGDYISFENIKIRVLWPEITDTAMFSYNDLPVKIAYDTAKSGYYVSYIQNDNNMQFDSFSNIEGYLNNEFDEIVGQDSPELRGAMSHFGESFNEYLQILHDNVEAPFESVNEAYTSLLYQHDLFFSSLGQHPERLNRVKQFACQQYNSLVTSMNAISLVCDCDEKFLFLGDAPKGVVDYLQSNSLFNDRYQFVKIQHHGTESHYTRKKPNGEYSLISNGGYSNRKVYVKYQNSKHILCTNAHNHPDSFCQYYIDKKECSPNCDKVDTGHVIHL